MLSGFCFISLVFIQHHMKLGKLIYPRYIFLIFHDLIVTISSYGAILFRRPCKYVILSSNYFAISKGLVKSSRYLQIYLLLCVALILHVYFLKIYLKVIHESVKTNFFLMYLWQAEVLYTSFHLVSTFVFSILA